MTYPLSSAVSVGDPTEASQYNNLRSDALFLGNDPETSGNMAQLLCAGVGSVRLSRSSLTEITLTASETVPCAVVIGGKIYTVTEDLTLTVSDLETIVHGRYYIHAVSEDDGTFSLSYSYYSNTPPDGSRVIGTFLWDGEGIIPDTVRNKTDYDIMMTTMNPAVCNGRLSVSASGPVPEADSYSSTAVYFHPYGGNRIGLRVGDAWEVFTFTRRDYSLSYLTNLNVPYDIFMKATKNGPVLTVVAWANKTTRQSVVSDLTGIKVLASDPEQRYLGTFATDSVRRVYDTAAARMIWNQYNRVGRPFLVKLNTSSAAVAHTDEWAPYFDDDAPSVRLIVPSAEVDFEITGVGISSPIVDVNINSGYASAIGLFRDYNAASLTPQVSCVPVFTHTFGNGADWVTIRNSDTNYRGDHTYTLAFWTNYTFVPSGTGITACGECPGITGYYVG